MTTRTVSRLTFQFDLRSTPGIGTPHAELFATYLDMCGWADEATVETAVVQLPEHHASPDGFLPSPIVAGAACLGRTRRVIARLVLLMPLYHPVRLAEDLAVLDLLGRGRLELLFGAGYRPEEFHGLGVALSERGRRMTDFTELLKAAWTGESFAWRGHEARVTPRPYQQPRPRIVLGGSSPASARRAARIADGYQPTVDALMNVYYEALGDRRPAEPTPHRDRSHVVVAVTSDPERTWAEIAPFCLHETNTYASWLGTGAGAIVERYKHFDDVETLRRSGPYVVLTPQQAVQWAADRDRQITIQPLVGGLPPRIAWETLDLLESHVLSPTTAPSAGLS